MKRIFFLIGVLIFYSAGLITAQTIFSNGTGGGLWSSASTWQGGVVPGVNNDVVIVGGDSVFTGTGARCNNLTLFAGAKVATSVDSVQVVNTLHVEDEAIFYNSANPRLPGGVIILEPASTVVHIGSGTLGGPGNDVFGNLVIQRLEGCTPIVELFIQGDLVINNFAANVVFRGARPPTTGSQRHTVLGDVLVLRGTLSCIDVGDNSMYGIWDIQGNVYVTDAGHNRDARIGPFSSANAAGLGIFNIGGNLIINGGRIQGGTSTSAGLGTAIFNIGGNMTLTGTAGLSSSTHAGDFAINFVGTGIQTVSSQIHFTFNTDVYDTVKTGSSVVFDLDTNYWRSTTGGEFVVEGSLEMRTISRLMGPGTFSLNPGATLKIGSPDGFWLSGTVGNIQVLGNRGYSADANYEYKSNVPQIFGDALPTTIGGLTINNPNGFALGTDYTINNSLSILSGSLDLNGHTITLGSDAVLSETPGNTVKGVTGKIVTTRNIGAPNALNIGGMGLMLTSGVDMGNTTVERYHSPRTGHNNEGIAKYYNIQTANNSGLNATLRFYYNESELNGTDENNLRLVKSPDGTNESWTMIGGSANPSENYVEQSGINELSYWTLTDAANSITNVTEEEDAGIPDRFSLEQNYPNPFNPSTVIKFQIPENSHISIKVYDVLGKEAAILVNEELKAGFYSVTFDASGLSSGIYFYTLQADNFYSTSKMILLK